MDKVAMLPAKDRQELFEAAAADRGMHPAVVEKDFWVCWTLRYLFASPTLGPNIVFKGGTSLSKVHGLIERFSEDIDLVLNWELLGYGSDGRNPWEEQASNTKRDRLNRQVNADAARYLETTFCPHLSDILSGVRDIKVWLSEHEVQVINIRYPAAYDLRALRPEVKLEIGPLASWVPSQECVIRPYAAESYPDVFEDADCAVVAIRAERTFWEKATILHQQAHRSHDMPPHYSRHYYDLYCMSQHAVKRSALGDLDLLSDVVRFKQTFYPSKWARYEDAKPGTFRLLPTERCENELVVDYRNMQPMFFRDPPSWETIIDGLAALEAEINGL